MISNVIGKKSNSLFLKVCFSRPTKKYEVGMTKKYDVEMTKKYEVGRMTGKVNIKKLTVID